MAQTPDEARKYYRHLSDQERVRATRARLQARNTQDFAEKTRLEGIADDHDERAKLYDQLHDRVK